MSFVSHYLDFLRRLRLPAVLIALAACGAFVFIYLDMEKLSSSAVSRTGPPYNPPENRMPPPPQVDAALNWDLFAATTNQPATSHADFAAHFRFAGTFFVQDAGGAERRKAVLSAGENGPQQIVAEGDAIDGVVVSRIFEDRLVLRKGADTVELHLSFSGASEDSTDDRAAAAKSSSAGGGVPEVTRFGRLVAKDSWKLDRKPLMEYYNELLEEPERLLNVFDSFEPLYKEGTHKIEGYHITVKGEDEFFKEIGLKEGDVIRKVNSLPMTNRRRAEFFIKQVVAERLNAVVIDIERNGKRKRLVYQIR